MVILSLLEAYTQTTRACVAPLCARTRIRARARQILGEYSQIRFLSGLWYKFRCMRASIHEPLYIPVTFELSACTESSVRYVKRSFSRVHSFRRKWLAATRVGNSISPYLDTRKTFVEEARERRPIRVDPIPPLLLIGY